LYPNDIVGVGSGFEVLKSGAEETALGGVGVSEVGGGGREEAGGWFDEIALREAQGKE